MHGVKVKKNNKCLYLNHTKHLNNMCVCMCLQNSGIFNPVIIVFLHKMQACRKGLNETTMIHIN
jgi:hypothetical protein